MVPAWTLELHCTSTCAFTDSNYLADEAGACVYQGKREGRVGGSVSKSVAAAAAAACPSERQVALVCSCHLPRKEPTQLFPVTETVN